MIREPHAEEIEEAHAKLDNESRDAPILRTSERRAFKRCQAAWVWGYREGLKPRGSEATPLWFGTGVHLALAEWYLPGTKRGRHPAETFAEFAGDSIHMIKVADKDFIEERLAEYEDGKTLGITLLEEYVKTYGTDPHMDFIQAEQPFELDIPWPKPEENRQSVYEAAAHDILVDYRGTTDGVYRNLITGKIELLENKTARSIILTHLALDDQAGSYWAIVGMSLRKAGLIGPKDAVHGINYNFLRKGKPDERPKDAEGYYTNKPVKADYLAALEVHWRKSVWRQGDLEAEVKRVGKLKLDDLAALASANKLTVLGERSKVQPPPLFHREMVHRTSKERNSQLRRIQDEAVQMQLVRDGSVTPSKNPTRECGWCSFKAMCELQERQGDWETFKKVAFRVEDPYLDHRKSAEEAP